jgi:CBS domain containing-hemolysin-like protein
VQTIDANTSVFDLTQMFLDSGFRRYPVIDNNELVGQISRKDLLRALLDLAR